MNVVMTGAGRFVEVQGTAEGMAFTRSELDSLLGLAEAGIKELTELQAAVLAEPPRAAVSGDGPLRLVVASANPDKAKEIVAVLSAALPVELLPRPADVPDVVEDGATLLDNARLKARALVAATGTAAVADDTGPRGRRARRRARRRTRPATRARTPPTPTTWPSCCASWRRSGRRRRAGGRGSAPWRWWPSPTAPRCGPRAWWRGRSPPEQRGATGSATTPCSCPTGRRRPDVRRDGGGGEGRGVAPGPGLPRPGAPAGGAARRLRSRTSSRDEAGLPRPSVPKRRRQLAVLVEREVLVVRDDLDADVVRPGVVVLADAGGHGRGVAPGDDGVDQAVAPTAADVVVPVAEASAGSWCSWAGPGRCWRSARASSRAAGGVGLEHDGHLGREQRAPCRGSRGPGPCARRGRSTGARRPRGPRPARACAGRGRPAPGARAAPALEGIERVQVGATTCE